MTRQQVLLSLFTVPTLATLMVLACSPNGQTTDGFAVFFICIVLAFVVNILAFIPAYLLQTEKFYDLIGTSTYILVIVVALLLVNNLDTRALLIGILVVVWAVRLGVFLFTRVHRVGKDDRFDTIKPDFLRFLNLWGLQALWVTLAAAPALVVISSQQRVAMDVFAWIGLAVWLFGFGMEIVADYQKTQFRKDAKNKGQFIQTGLWSRSQHPNYFGEITLWVGITIMALPILQDWQWVAIISPFFVAMLLTKVSGIPMLRAKAEERWGGQEDYEQYKANTPVLIPKL